MMGFSKKPGGRPGKRSAADQQDPPPAGSDAGSGTEDADRVPADQAPAEAASAYGAGDGGAGDGGAGDGGDVDDSRDTVGDAGGRKRTARLLAAALVGALAFTAVAAVGGWRWAELQDDAAGDANSAFVDQAKTAEVASAAREIVEGVFSYDYTDLDSYEDALHTYLDDEMLDRYEETADQNEQIITQAKTTITASVADGDVGVEQLQDGRASALAIMSRTGSNGDSQEISDAAPLRVIMRNVDGQWKADKISLL